MVGAWRYPFPVLTGLVSSNGEGTEIRITTRPSVPGLIGPGAILVFATYAAWDTKAIALVLVPIAVILPLTLAGWFTGALRARTILERYLGAGDA